MTSPTIDIEALKAVAEKATPGEHVALSCRDIPSDCCDYGVVAVALGRETCRVWEEADARFYAAANPAVVLSLIARTEAAEGEVERLKADHDEERHVEIYDTGYEDGRGAQQEVIDGLVERATAAEARIAELVAQRDGLVGQMERIAKVARGCALDNITTATNRLNVVIDIARAALSTIQTGGES